MEFLADLHTKVIHFPIALLITYSFLEIIGIVFNRKLFTQSAYIILITGIIGIFFIYKTAMYGGELINKFGVGTEYKNEQMQDNF